MPPVFGPVSPSPTRLWSCAGSSGSDRRAVGDARTATTSGPSRKSSTTTRAPGRRQRRRARRSRPSLEVLGDQNALARSQPVGLHDVRRLRGAPGRATACVGVCAGVRAAVGTPAAAMTSLAKDLEPSICARLGDGPNTGDARGADRIRDARDQRGLGTDDDEVEARASAATAAGSSGSTSSRLGDAGRCPRCPGRTTSAVTAGSRDRARHEGVLTGTGADDEDLHAEQATDELL